MSTQPTNPQEEIDLGSLFSQIGNMFSGLLNAIGSLAKSVFHYAIVAMLFLKKNSIILGVATVIGVLLGVFMQSKKNVTYSSLMQVEVNFNSGNRLYDKIDYINNLIEINDSSRLASIFNITPSAANKLLGFSVEAIEPEKQILKDYDKYMQETDTVFTRGFELIDFKSRITEGDLKDHVITATGKSATGFENLKEGITTLVENDFYKSLREIELKELLFTKQEKEKNLREVDSLRKRYKKVALLQANKESITTDVNFTTSNIKDRNVDMDLYYMSGGIVEKLKEINSEIAKKQHIIKIKSNFDHVGIANNKLISKAWFKYGIWSFLFTLIILSSIKFNKYLVSYQKTIEKNHD